MGIRLMRHVLIESYPNREIRVTLVRQQVSQRKTGLDSKRDIGSYENEPDPHLSFAQNSPTSTEPHKGRHQKEGGRPGFGGLPRPQRFSVYGRRTILRAGGALERAHPHNECLFLTLTLPGSTRESFEAIARYSGMAVQSLHRWLSNHIPNKLSIYTWEWQQRGALHLHYVVHCPDRDRGEWIIKNLKSEWIRILDSICKASQIDLYRKHSGFSWASNKEITRVDAQWCEKSVAAYLSKYVSKGSEANKKMSLKSFFPSRWYGVSRPLLQLTREMSFKVSLDSLRDRDAWAMYEDCLAVLQSWGIKCYEYRHKVGDGKTIVSYSLETEQESIWHTIMTQICPTPDSCTNTEQNMRRLVRNGSILLRKHATWLKEFMGYYGKSRPGNLLNLSSYRDISRSDLVFLVDALAYSFRSHQRTRFELPGECKLWYSQMKTAIDSAPSEDREWIGHLKL